MSPILANALLIFTSSVICFHVFVWKRRATESVGDYRFRAVTAAIGIMLIAILLTSALDKLPDPTINFPHLANPGAAGAAP